MIEASPKHNLIFKWINWHYFETPKNLLLAFWNFLVFNFNYFSVALLLRTFFSPWRKYRESYGRGFDPKVFVWAFVNNMISRGLGMVVRSVMILVGLILEVLIFFGGIVSLLIWIFLPPFLLIIFWSGLQLLIGI